MAPAVEKKIAKAHELLRKGEFQGAQAQAEEALELARSENDLQALESALNVALTARVNVPSQGVAGAMRLAKSELAQQREKGSWKGEVTAMIALAELHLMAGQKDDAIRLGTEAQMQCSQEGDPGLEATVLTKVLATAHVAKGDDAKAQAAADSAVEAARRSRDDAILAVAYFTQGTVRFDTSSIDSAVEPMEKALSLYQETKNLNGQTAALRSLAEMRLGTEEAHRATEEAMDALDIAQKVRDQDAVLAALAAVVQTHLGAGKLEVALQACRERLDICRASGDKEMEANTLASLAVVQKEMGKVDEALKTAFAGTELCQHMGNGLAEAHMWLTGAKIAYDARRLEVCLYAAGKASPLFKDECDAKGEKEARKVYNQAYVMSTERCKQMVHEEFYKNVRGGIAYGPRFRDLTEIMSRSSGQPNTYACLELHEEAAEWENSTHFHAGMIDAAAHTGFAMMHGRIFLPDADEMVDVKAGEKASFGGRAGRDEGPVIPFFLEESLMTMRKGKISEPLYQTVDPRNQITWCNI